MTGEVVILGSGPAGAAAALLLTRWGHRVTVRTKRARNASLLVESIPPSTAKLIDLLGLRAAFDRAGFLRASGNTVSWGGRDARVERFEAGEQGWHVARNRLEDVLISEMTAAGVSVLPADTFSQVEESLFVLDCTGRVGAIARERHLRVYEEGPRTVALTGVWQASPSFRSIDATHTLIESYQGGWAWSCPDSPAVRIVAAMVDPATSGLARDRAPREIYLHEIGKTREVAALVQEATLVDGPAGWDASMYHAARYADGNVLLVGDAASFVDPLSSAGVKKAFASGWLAAVAVNTALRQPAMRDVAFAFHGDRESEMYESLKAMTTETLAAAAAGHDHPFWDERNAREVSTERASLAAAYERLRSEEVLHVRVDAGVRIENRAAINGNEIVLEARVVSPDQPAGMRYAFDVDLLGILSVAPTAMSVPDAFNAYNERHAPAALPDFLGALSTALARKWLVWV